MDILLHILGYLILRFKYPNKAERKQVLEYTYDNDYMNAGAEYPLKFIAFILFLALLGFLVVSIYKTIF